MIWLHFKNGTMPLWLQLMWCQWCRCTYKNDDDNVGNYNDELEDDKAVLLVYSYSKKKLVLYNFILQIIRMISTWIHLRVSEGTNSQFLWRFLMSSSRVSVSPVRFGRISVYVWVFYYARPEAGNGTQGHSINTERQQARLINLLSIWCSIKRLWWNIWIFMYADTVTLNLVFPYHRPSMNLRKPFLTSYEMQSWKTWSGFLGFW